ncbi:MAG TPA: peptidoglycan DD-metalloendopeptidase family protein [Dokdonella sp.]|uniref:peptidoglycan DD-metalloendopeptidase family protein n=1 Tax=Dokdonella sp. TaxID=2291710 RepID=UPI002BED1847|nr:peptidoglycan DD-metalloendopeptidase family protein [Dokdonella sp.]HUD42080.1 peptidoglycan DD-metalloendopeptidase family protein [Dokdonella sp.]
MERSDKERDAVFGRYARRFGAWLMLGLLAGCASTGPAPVEDRSGRSRPPAAAERPVAALPAGASHRVVRGDTLYGIAFRNGLDYRDLARWNGIGPPYTIRVGEQLRLTDPARSAAAAPPPRPPASVPPPSRPVATTSAPPAATPALPPAASAATRPATPATTTSSAASTAPAPAPAATPPAAPPPPPPPPPAPAASSTSAGIAWRWPLAGSVLAGYVAGDPARSGIDISGKAGGQVVAAADGEVVYSGNGLVGYGELVIIKHSPSLLSAYARNGRRLVDERARVKAGQPIAELASGRPILHFEIRRNGKPINPLEYLPSR